MRAQRAKKDSHFGRRIGVAGLLALAACSSHEHRWVEPPDLGDARGIVTVVHTSSGPRAFAADVTDGAWRIQEDVMGDDTLAIDVLVYRCPLDAWLPGTRELSVVASGRPLPPASRVYSGTLADGFAWKSEDTVPDRTADLAFDYADHARCSALETERVVPLNRDAEPRLLVAFDEAHVLVGTRDGDLYVVSRDGARDPFLPGVTSDGDPYLGGFRASDGTVYLVSNGGSCLARVDDEATATRIACLPLAGGSGRGSWYDADGELTPDGLAVAVRTDTGRVFVKTATSAEFRELDFGAPSGASDKAGLVWAGEGRFFAAGPLPRDVLVYTNGVVTQEHVQVLPIDILNGVTIGPENGPLVVSNFGEVYMRPSEDGWREFGTCGIAEARLVVESGGRTWCGGMGLVAEIGQDSRACPAEVTVVGKILRLVRLGEDRIAMTARVDGSSEVHFLRVVEPYVSACVE